MRIAARLLIVAGSLLAAPLAAEPMDFASVRLAFTKNALATPMSQGVADRTTGRGVTADDPVRIASISKLVVAIGVLRLVEQGRLDLDADVSTYLGWPLRNPAFPGRAITLRLLLSHRSSLVDGIDYALPLDQSLRAALADPAAWDRDHAPGGYFRYANINFPVVASVMERVTGERFDRLMHRLVLRPLGLHACFNWASCDDATIARTVTLYDAAGKALRDDDRGRRHACPVVPARDGGCDLSRWEAGRNGALFSPQGGLRISARDLGRIGQMLLNDGRVGGRRFLKPASIDLLLRPLWIYDGSNGVTGETTAGSICRYGLASQTLSTGVAGCADDLFGDGRAWVGHAGEAYGLRSGLWIDRERGRGVAYFVTGVADDAPLAPGTAFTRAEVEAARGAPEEGR
jgi:CubicO group peptidase (beta-lactamase class C family)